MPKRLAPGSTFGSQLALLCAILLAPLILLTALFVHESWRDIAFAGRELQGERYISAIWPEFYGAASGAAAPVTSSEHLAFVSAARELDSRFGTSQASARFTAAPTPAAKAQAGGALITAVADNSNLTLDTDLDTFYLMAATVVRLPALAQAATEAARASMAGAAPLEQAAAFARLQTDAATAQHMLTRAVGRAPAKTREALRGRISALSAAADALAAAVRPGAEGGSPATVAAAEQRLQREIDLTWRAASAQLTRLLQARRARLLTKLWGSLAFVTLFVAASLAAAWAIARRLTVRVVGLEAAMARLTAGDLAADVPYRADQGEIGRIAGGVEAFKQASAEKARLMEELAAAYATLQDSQSWLKLALTTGRMGAWRRKFPRDVVELSPELSGLIGFPADRKVTTADIEPLFLDRELVQRWKDDADKVAAGELDKLTLEETIAPFRRFDTGEIRWVLLRREVLTDPVHGALAVVGVGIDITERKHMMDELNHRVKNNLATVLSIAMQTAKSAEGLQEFMKAFTSRVQVLAKTNELLTRHGWGQVGLKDVLTTALSPWLAAGVEFAAGSPDTKISSRAAVSLSLVLNELGANAARWGALSAEGGRVEIAWSEPEPGRGALTWTERAAHPTPPPTGFSATLIQRLMAGDLGGGADLDFRPEGLAATLTFALLGATA